MVLETLDDLSTISDIEVNLFIVCKVLVSMDHGVQDDHSTVFGIQVYPSVVFKVQVDLSTIFGVQVDFSIIYEFSSISS